MRPTPAEAPPGEGHRPRTGLPLAGVRVLDLTMNIAGPYAAMILADLGADVVKIERPGGDDARRMVPRFSNGSAYFYAINRNKTARQIDLQTDAGRSAFAGELRCADVLLTNLRPATLRKLGLDPDDLMAANPGLIYADISAYGTSGNEADRPGYDMVLQARSGIMSINGNPDGPPARVGVSALDMGSGQWIALGVIAALYQRKTTGAGARVSTSLLETGAAMMAYDIAAYQLTGQIPQRRGSGHPSFGPYGVFSTKDGMLAIGVGSDNVFSRLAGAVGVPGWSSDPRFRTNADRMAHSSDLRQELEARLAVRTAYEWVPVLADADVPADVVADTADVLADAQLEALGTWLDLTVGEDNQRSLRVPGLPLRFDGTRPPLRRPVPEHASPEPQPAASGEQRRTTAEGATTP